MKKHWSKAVCCILISCFLCGCGAETNAQAGGENYELVDIDLSEGSLSETEKEEKYNTYLKEQFQEDVSRMDGIDQVEITFSDKETPAVSIQLTFSEELQQDEREALKKNIADYAGTIWENYDLEIDETEN